MNSSVPGRGPRGLESELTTNASRNRPRTIVLKRKSEGRRDFTGSEKRRTPAPVIGYTVPGLMVVLASNPCRVHVLPELLVRKIAAGEVVERPASVLKELVENSLDAGATRIGITIEEGGARLIRVVDDGHGMTPEELRLSVAAHSTSKIATEEDLFAIATLGFRGEALASISAVSKLRMVSRRPDSDEGFEVRLTGDVLEAARASGCPPGTTVEVGDLFFNVPARRKFLRAVSTEVGHVNEQFTRFALAYPSVGLELINNRRATFALPPAATRIERIGKLFGPELAGALLKIEREEAGLRLEAHAAMPAQSRATPQWQYVFVNGRYIRDRYVQHAVREAYRGLMEPNRHPVIFLFLSIDPSQIDVNVHPTKIEVRWADANLIHSQVLSALREAFQRANLSPMLRTNPRREQLNTDEQDRLRREFAESLLATPPLEPGAPPAYGGLANSDGSRPMGAENRLPGGQGPHQAEFPGNAGLDSLEIWRKLYGPNDRPAPENSDFESGRQSGYAGRLPLPVDDVSFAGTTAAAPSSAGGLVPSRGRPRAIQMHNLYLVAETEDGIVIVDQHALHERVIYEQLRRRLAEGDLEPQRLLLPETVKVTARESAAVDQHAPLLNRLGIETTPFGADAIAVHSFPSLLKDTQITPFMRDLLDFLSEQETSASAEVVIHRVLDMMACKAAVKAGDRLAEGEIEALIDQRHLIEKASSCPHGRPTMLRLTKADLNRQFKRT